MLYMRQPHQLAWLEKQVVYLIILDLTLLRLIAVGLLLIMSFDTKSKYKFHGVNKYDYHND